MGFSTKSLRFKSIKKALLSKTLKRYLQHQLSAAVWLCVLSLGVSHAATNKNFYRVAQKNGVWWFIAPDGTPFFSNGVNVVSPGATRTSYRFAHPEYAAFRHYPNDVAWARATLSRLRSWNFNTIGGWSSDVLIGSRAEMPYTIVLDLGRGAGVPWSDLFSARAARQFDRAARRQIVRFKDDSRLLGYFTDNELGWWDDTLLLYFLKQPRSNATRRVLMRLIRRHYQNDFKQLERDFDAGDARSFAALDARAALKLRPGGRGQQIIDKFMYLLADRYYKLAHDAIRRYDANHLILGDRYLGWYVPAVARAAGKYLDVVSVNYAADWNNGEISHYFLDTLHKLTNKPIIITEYYMCAMENRSGNRNSSANFPVVRTQRERATSFSVNLAALAHLPYVVGAHWFQYFDEPTRGRGDGENYNMGLVDIGDQPYAELTAVAAALQPSAIHARATEAMIEPQDEIVILKTQDDDPNNLHEENKQGSFIKSSAGSKTSLPFADLYARWDATNLYFKVYASDFAEPYFYARGKIPEDERMTWTMMIGKGNKPLTFRFGPGEATQINDLHITQHEWRKSTKHTLIVKISAAALGRDKLTAGDVLQLHATLTSHSRAEEMEWNHSLRLKPSN